MDSEPDRERTGQTGDLRPRPDPTDKTTDQLIREVVHVDKSSEQRVLHVKDVYHEKIEALKAQQKDRDHFTELLVGAHKLSLETALAAAKELTAIQNSFFTSALKRSDEYAGKQLEALGIRLNDNKDRITVLETSKDTKSENEKNNRDNTGLYIALIGLLASTVINFFLLVVGAIGILIAFFHH
jgi:hypothetical protein